MRIIQDELFKSNIQAILKHITIDSKTKASSFNTQLFCKISALTDMPYRFRRSYYHEDDAIRDLIFKGYTIPYLIDEGRGVIVILDIFKWSHRDTPHGSAR